MGWVGGFCTLELIFDGCWGAHGKAAARLLLEGVNHQVAAPVPFAIILFAAAGWQPAKQVARFSGFLDKLRTG
jgi:hypothetical protein